MNKEDILNSITKEYSTLSESSQTEILAAAKIIYAEKGTTLVREETYSEKTFYIAKGCARAYYLKDGKDISDWFAFENEFISSIVSFFSGLPSPHSVEVLEDSILFELTRDRINALSDKHRDFERLTKIVVIKTMLRHQERIASIQFQKANQRYTSLIRMYPNITQRVSLTHIASYLGITLETLSRLRRVKK
jgi:CRP-like cAMP-binding protein